MVDVFISYSRKDKEFVKTLHAALAKSKRDIWVDWQDIPLAEEWWKAIEAGIEGADTFVLIISPDSAGSKVCTQEVEYAVQHNKRLVPILHREGDVTTIHPAISAVNWIYMRANDDFDSAFQSLLNTIDTDLKHVRAHTRLLQRAIEWQREKQDNSFLLRGKDLAASIQWLKQGVDKTPQPTPLQHKYITVSQQIFYRRPHIYTAALTSLAVTTFVAGVRFFGLLQTLELTAYDQLLRLRPTEPLDERLLIVEVDERDFNRELQRAGNRLTGSVSDTSLVRLIRTLQQYQPRAITFDLYRESPGSELKSLLATQENIFAVCKASDDTLNPDGRSTSEGIDAPLGVPEPRRGFSDYLNEDTVRRQLLLLEPDANIRCTGKSLNLAVAQNYLEAEGIQYTPFTPNQDLRLANQPFQRLNAQHGGGYDLNTDWSGYQILLNYRSVCLNLSTQSVSCSPRYIARRYTLTEVLEGNVLTEETVKDRIVLIGVTTSNSVDSWSTPYTLGFEQKLPGVIVQAQMISQILSAVLDDRPLLVASPIGFDLLWVGVWSGVGASVVWSMKRQRQAIGVVVVSGLGIGFICFFVLMQGIWIPLVPPVLALYLTSGWLVYRTTQLRRQ